MSPEKAKVVIKNECYIFDPMNLDRTTMVNEALDIAVSAIDTNVKNEILEKMVAVQDEVIQMQDEQINNLTELVKIYRLKLERVKALISTLEGDK